MATVVGTVEKVWKNATKSGKAFIYAVVVNGTRYHAGFDDPGCGEGDKVKFETKTGEFGGKPREEIVGKVLRAKGSPATPAAPSEGGASGGKSGGGGGFKGGFKSGGGGGYNSPERLEIDKARLAADADRQRSISSQAARNTAVAVLQVAQAAGVKLPIGPANKPGLQWENLLKLVDELTAKFYADSNDQAFLEGITRGTVSTAVDSSEDAELAEATEAPAKAEADDEFGEASGDDEFE